MFAEPEDNNLTSKTEEERFYFKARIKRTKHDVNVLNASSVLLEKRRFLA